MSNYPPGVTGNEFEIAGPDWEGPIDRDCEDCRWIGEVDAWGYQGTLHWTCPECNTEHEEYGEDDE